MSNLQNIRRRIRSVKNTRQITKAMQLVAASKMRQAEDMAQKPLEYNQRLTEALGRLQSAAIDLDRHPLYAARNPHKGLTIVVSADRGMAGAYNQNVLRLLNQHVKESKVPQIIVSVGKHATSYATKVETVDELAAYDVDAGDADEALARPIIAETMQLFSDGQIDQVFLIYTQFFTTIKQEAVIEQLLPMAPSPLKEPEALVEPNLSTAIDLASRRLLEGKLTAAILSSRASEQASRMLAMMNATNNASDLIDDLTLSYNDARQNAITNELADITGGAEALTNG